MTSRALTAIPAYDASYNAAVSRSMAAGEGFGAKIYQTFEIYPANVTTGSTMLLPVAAALTINDSPFVPNVVSGLLVVLALVGVFVVWRSDGASALAFSGGMVAMAAAVVRPVSQMHSLMGEVLAAVLIIFACSVYVKARTRSGLIRAGWLAGLALYTKVIVLIPLVAMAVALPWVLHSSFREQSRRLLMVLTGIGGVVVLNELFRLAQFGSVSGYVGNWVDFVRFIGRPDVGAGIKGGWGVTWERVAACFQMVRTVTTPVGLAVVAAGLIGTGILADSRRRGDATTSWHSLGLLLGIGGAALLFWWVFKSSSTFGRHAQIGLVLLAWSLAAAVLAGWNALPTTSRHRRAAAWLVALSVSGAVALALPLRTTVDARTASLLEFSQRLKDFLAIHPEATIWSSGWWRHWDVQQLVDLDLHDLKNPDTEIKQGDFVLVSDYFNWEQDKDVERVVNESSRRLFSVGPFSLLAVTTPQEGGDVPELASAGFNPKTGTVWAVPKGAVSLSSAIVISVDGYPIADTIRAKFASARVPVQLRGRDTIEIAFFNQASGVYSNAHVLILRAAER